MARGFSVGGKPTFLLGVNYWSRAGGPRMWERFDEAAVAAELRQMAEIGLNTCRSFTFVPTMMPHPPTLEPGAMASLGRFFDLCSEAGLGTIPSFMVGHMSGENYDFPGQRGRSLYEDPELLVWQRALAEGVARLGAPHPAVIAYLASNEMPLWGGRTRPRVVASWGELLRRALRDHDPVRPFGLGDGVMNLKGGQNGFDVDLLRDRGVVDFIGPHTYYTDADPLRQALNAEFCLRSLSYLGLPVLFEEFGCSSCQASEENQAHYFREVFAACLSSGAAGALGWCWSDFDLPEQRPYRFQTFELGFGITRADGSEKPVCDEFRAVRRLLSAVGEAPLQGPPVEAAIVVPDYFNRTYPFSWENRGRMRRTLLQAYALCTAAGIEAELVPERRLDLARYRLVLLPATQKLRAPTWLDLGRFVDEGGTLYWSYFSGDNDFHQGAWCADFEGLTGCRHTLRYGCYDLPPARAELRGEGLGLAVDTEVGAPYPRAILPITPLGAEVIGRDGAGAPALTEHRRGAGRVLLLNHPWEFYLAEQAAVNAADQSHRLYRLVADRAGLKPAVPCDAPWLQTRISRAEGGTLLWLINHGWSEVEARVDAPTGEPLLGAERPLEDGAQTVRLAPKQVAVYRVRGGEG